MYVSNVFWAGKQIDSEINPTQSGAIQAGENPPNVTPPFILAGAPTPVARHRTSIVWAQGVNCGFEFKF